MTLLDRTVFVIICATLVWGSDNVGAQPTSRAVVSEIVFSAPASGGSLLWQDGLNPNPETVSIETAPGESPESVANRLAEAINAMYRSRGFAGGGGVKCSGARIWNKPGAQPGTLGGTEHGLGIPVAPYGLSAAYNSSTGSFQLQWHNGDKYDALMRTINSGQNVMPIRGDLTSYTIERIDPQRGEYDVTNSWVVIYGVKGGCPSPPAAIALDRCTQRESLGYVGGNDLPPNWRRWSLDGDPNSVEVRFRKRDVRRGTYAGQYMDPAQKPSYYTMRSVKPGVVCGLSRRFIGLAPGHKYSMGLRLNTPGDLGNGVLQLCAAGVKPNVNPDEKALAAVNSQTTGSIFNGTRLLAQKPLEGTRGTWRSLRSGDVPDSAGPVLELPADCTEILVWIVCKDLPGEGVSFDRLELHDLTCDPQGPSERHEQKSETDMTFDNAL